MLRIYLLDPTVWIQHAPLASAGQLTLEDSIDFPLPIVKRRMPLLTRIMTFDHFPRRDL